MKASAAVRGRAPWAGLIATACVAVATWWWLLPGPSAAPAAASTAVLPLMAAGAPPPAVPPAVASAATAAGRPLSALGEAQRKEQLALWQGRLARAQLARDNYLQAARYPHESRPMSEHPDQVHPFEPIAEDRPLRMPGGSVTQGVRLKTTQERVFASGNESNRVTVALQDDAGRPLPLRITRAVQREVTPPGRTASTPDFQMPVSSDSNGVFTMVMQPARQGFSGFAGTVRLELALEYGGQPGFLFFDLVYSPEQAATWLPGVREALEGGSLAFYARAQVLLAGRYVVTARIFDANGKAVALAQFNGEVPAGTADFRLPLFGKLVRDSQPAFPLQLRDVEAFLLKPDTFPDRVMLPRLAGVQHTSKTYPLASFADAEWQSDERARYLAELGKDVAAAEQAIQRLQP
jgi:hypothetical protein